MTEKFDKYWKRTSGLLAIATILDPRNKMDCVEFYFRMFYEDDAHRQLSKVRKCLDDLVVEYQSKIDTMQNASATSKKRPVPSSFEDEEDEFAQSKKTKIRKVNVKCEVDFYLEEDPLPDDEDLDTISWWKVNRKYPTLRKITKDILAIPVSSVASESAFSTGGRVISPHRSRLHSETVEALMCLQNWMMEDLKGEMENTHACSTIIDDSETTEEDNETRY